ncbi:unnamed protein product, partial [Rotaria magnacalcarata]
MPFNAADLCSRVNELLLFDSIGNSCTSVVDNCKSSIMSLVHGSLITKITIDADDLVKAAELEPILRMAYNVNTLEICDETGILSQAILRNTDNLGTRADEQIVNWDCEVLNIFCTLLSNQLCNLKTVSFNICDSYDDLEFQPPYIIHRKNDYTQFIVELIYSLVDHLQQLVSLHIHFIQPILSNPPCFPHLIRRQLHQQSLSRPYRLRCSEENIQIRVLQGRTR